MFILHDHSSTTRILYYVGEEDQFEVVQYLNPLDERDICRLGTALGLYISNLKKMKHLPEDMVHAWLLGKDNVLERSGRTNLEWSSHSVEASTSQQHCSKDRERKTIKLNPFLYNNIIIIIVTCVCCEVSTVRWQ